MPSTDPREVWLRGPLPHVPPLLQPVAHALLQAREEVADLLRDFPPAQLWEKPAGVASVGFHLQHLTGVLGRLFTYAKDQSLSPEQLTALANEGKCPPAGGSGPELVHAFERQVEQALAELRATDEAVLTEPRGVGRAQLPSTVLGLLVHAAEHTMRHVGQLSVTTRMLRHVASQ